MDCYFDCFFFKTTASLFRCDFFVRLCIGGQDFTLGHCASRGPYVIAELLATVKVTIWLTPLVIHWCLLVYKLHLNNVLFFRLN